MYKYIESVEYRTAAETINSGRSLKSVASPTQ